MEKYAASSISRGSVFIIRHAPKFPVQQLKGHRCGFITYGCMPSRPPIRVLRFRNIFEVQLGVSCFPQGCHCDSRRQWSCFSTGTDGKDCGPDEEIKKEGSNGNITEGEKLDVIDGEEARRTEETNTDPRKQSWFWGRGQVSQRQSVIKDASERGVEENLRLAVDETIIDGPGSVDGGGSGDSDTSREDDKTSRSRQVTRKEKVVPPIWRRLMFWKENKEDDDDDIDLNPDEKLIVRDLENLTFNWKELFDPTVENILALGLTALLAAAFFKISMQLVGVIITILVTALKYTVLATLLLGLLIFVL